MSAFDPDDNEPPSVVMYGPPRAAGEFDYRTGTTDKYICVWPSLPDEPQQQLDDPPHAGGRAIGGICGDSWWVCRCTIHGWKESTRWQRGSFTPFIEMEAGETASRETRHRWLCRSMRRRMRLKLVAQKRDGARASM